MLMMNVYRAQQAVPLQMTMADCLGAAATEVDISLISLCARLGRPTLVGLDALPSIIKPVGEGDEALSFEALFDSCLTLVDLRKMQEAGVDNPGGIPPVATRLDVNFDIDGRCRLSIAIMAGDLGTVHARFRDLLKHDRLFQSAIFDAVIERVDQAMRAEGTIAYRIDNSTSAKHEPIEPPLAPTGPRWRILPPD